MHRSGPISQGREAVFTRSDGPTQPADSAPTRSTWALAGPSCSPSAAQQDETPPAAGEEEPELLPSVAQLGLVEPTS